VRHTTSFEGICDRLHGDEIFAGIEKHFALIFSSSDDSRVLGSGDPETIKRQAGENK